MKSALIKIWEGIGIISILLLLFLPNGKTMMNSILETQCERQHVHRHEYCRLYSHGAFLACVCFKSDFLSKRKHDKTIFRVGYRLNDNYPYQPDDVLTQTLRFTVEKCLLFFPTPYIIQYRLY